MFSLYNTFVEQNQINFVKKKKKGKFINESSDYLIGCACIETN